MTLSRLLAKGKLIVFLRGGKKRKAVEILSESVVSHHHAAALSLKFRLTAQTGAANS